ncbi:MAG: hypothetical protein V3V61_04605, partial [Gammaproteobacteria bacterium]
MSKKSYDIDPVETQEWLDALASVTQYAGTDRARYLLDKISAQAHTLGISQTTGVNTAYLNTIPKGAEAQIPEDHGMFRLIGAFIR